MENRNGFRKRVSANVLASVVLTAVSDIAVAGTSTPAAKLDRIYTYGSAHAIELDSTVIVTGPLSSCGNWSSAQRAYIYPITDDAAKAKLAVAMLAMASGKKVTIAASSCQSTTGYPLIDTLYIYN